MNGSAPYRKVTVALQRFRVLVDDVSIALTVVAATGCGGSDPALPATCIETPRQIELALQRAPATVILGDGTLLSQCVARAKRDADLQNVGSVLTATADQLATRMDHADGASALQLGFLVGASRRGALHNGGISDELVRHLEQTAAPDRGPRMSAAFQRGLAAGERVG